MKHTQCPVLQEWGAVFHNAWWGTAMPGHSRAGCCFRTPGALASPSQPNRAPT